MSSTIRIETNEKDHWSSKAYQDAAGFVPQLTQTVVKYLNPRPGERILDLGCGDGVLTSQIAKIVSQEGGQVVGLDASPSMISAATSNFPATKESNCSFFVQDCARFSSNGRQDFLNGKWEKVFSNAAMHWIMRVTETRDNVLKAAFDALQPGGIFVFEMGGHGNVTDVHAALIAALVDQGISAKKARELSPWFFPSVDWMRVKLESIGFAVEICEDEYRPTKLTPKDGKGNGGLEGWVRLMGAAFLDAIDEETKRNDAIKMVCDILESVITREEDGSQWLGYVRLRCKAVKPK